MSSAQWSKVINCWQLRFKVLLQATAHDLHACAHAGHLQAAAHVLDARAGCQQALSCTPPMRAEPT
jgi:hypothetical protein